MSAIGGGNPANIPLVGSVAGSAGQQRVAGVNQQVEAAAAQTFAAQRQAQLNRAIGDVGESAESGDRDADGREAWRWSEKTGSHRASPSESAKHAVDPDAERGQALDLDA